MPAARTWGCCHSMLASVISVAAIRAGAILVAVIQAVVIPDAETQAVETPVAAIQDAAIPDVAIRGRLQEISTSRPRRTLRRRR